jgi:hypothetical protein
MFLQGAIFPWWEVHEREGNLTYAALFLQNFGGCGFVGGMTFGDKG